MSPLRVVQWTTGKPGSAAVRGIVSHPGLELVGCYAFSPHKVGHDAGALAGLGTAASGCRRGVTVAPPEEFARRYGAASTVLTV